MMGEGMILEIRRKSGDKYVFGGNFTFIAGPAKNFKGDKKLTLDVFFLLIFLTGMSVPPIMTATLAEQVCKQVFGIS